MSSTDDKKVLVVLGATGNQGGSVVRTFLNDPVLASQWHVRGTTRNASSVAAVELSKLGAEMVSASLYSEAELRSAFTDATAIFAVTDFWTAIQDPALHKQAQETGTHLTIIAQEVEETWGRNLAAAASDIPSLERFVFSSLPSVTELSHGKYKHVHHYDGKANIVKNIQQSYPELWSKMSQILVGSYNSNILPGSYFPPVYNPATKKAEFDGPVSPDALWPFINAPISTGLFVKALILDEPVGTILAAFDEWKSIQQIIDLLTRFTGKEFGYVQKTVEEMAAASPIGLELPETYLFASEYGALGEKADGWKNTLTLPSDLKAKIERPSFEKWLQEQDWSSVFEAA
ncbi:NmrA-like family protein [Colletotrichum truncatum]|uniref:NmrA-like family protein n=1 Tax=Colletotrichum truncatum TaxID=5467 RepID=A0ACC3ZCW2_COLTU|nr:NmrA-like family protein [Colletotrichum truncatum]KAF6797938.1 NmrA-like family protein [Colletotrichum truncatum]